MSNQVFALDRARPFVEWQDHPSVQTPLEGDYTLSQATGSGSYRYRSRFNVRLTDSTDVATWETWLADHEGRHDSWLIKAVRAPLKKVTLASAGTGDGSTTAFALSEKHIDESTLLVYKAGVLQTLTTHYTVSGNNTAPTVTFLSAPTLGQAITYTVEFYFPVRFASPPPPPTPRNITSDVYLVEGVEVESIGEGSHLA